MSDETVKHCYNCNKDLPATTEYFFPSYLKEGGKNICKTCHAESSVQTVSFRDRLRDVAKHVQQDEVPSYQSLNSVAKAIGWSVAKVERDIYESKVPVFKFTYNNVGPALALRREDAETYIAVHERNGHSHDITVYVEAEPEVLEAEPEVLIAGTPDECASCGTTKGNILAVLDENREIRAYMCSTCYRTASSYKWEPERMRRVADLIERIGAHSFTV